MRTFDQRRAVDTRSPYSSSGTGSNQPGWTPHVHCSTWIHGHSLTKCQQQSESRGCIAACPHETYILVVGDSEQEKMIA